MLKRLLLFSAIALFSAPGFAASSNVSGLTTSPAIVGTQLFYCPIGATTDYKCTAAQIAAYNFSLMSGDCTATSGGALTCTKAGSNVGPGYLAGVRYLPFGSLGRIAAGSAPASITTAYCTALWFNNIAASGGSGTLASIILGVTTAGTTSMTAAIYANDATATPYRPGALVGAGSTSPDVSTQPAPTFSGVSLNANTMYWVCVQAGDTTVRFETLPASSSGQASYYLQLVGAAVSTGPIGQDGSPPTNGVLTTTGITSYGTWPSTFHGATFTETALGPWFGFSFTSIP